MPEPDPDPAPPRDAALQRRRPTTARRRPPRPTAPLYRSHAGRSRWSRPGPRSSRGLVLLLVSVTLALALALAAILLSSPARPLRAATEDLLWPQKEQCRIPADRTDQCEYVRTHCQSSDSGVIPYLQIYYCYFAKARPAGFALLLGWLAVLFSTLGVAASDFLSVNLSTISSLLHLTESVAGVTFLAFGNGSPDVFSTFAAMRTGHGSLALGELYGAAAFITMIVLGSMCWLAPFHVTDISFVRELCFFIIAVGCSLWFIRDGYLDIWECGVMVGYYVFYVLVVVVWHWTLSSHPTWTRTSAGRQNSLRLLSTSSRLSADPVLCLDGQDITESPTDMDDDSTDKQMHNYMANMVCQNMRLLRSRQPSPRSTVVNQPRPSLVGVMEFRSFLSGLESERSATPQSAVSEGRPGYFDLPLRSPSRSGTMSLSGPQMSNFADRLRRRASSINDVPTRSSSGQYSISPRSRDGTALPNGFLSPFTPLRNAGSRAQTPDVSAGLVSPYAAEPISPRTVAAPFPLFASSPACGLERAPTWPERVEEEEGEEDRSSEGNPFSTARLSDEVERTTTSRAEVELEEERHESAFAVYRRRLVAALFSLFSPKASAGSGLEPEHGTLFDGLDEKLGWWPHSALPPPEEILSTFFPTLVYWSDGTVATRVLAIATAPSVFLLTLTVPVVGEGDSEEDNRSDVPAWLNGPDGRPVRLQSLEEGEPAAPPRLPPHLIDPQAISNALATSTFDSLRPGSDSSSSAPRRPRPTPILRVNTHTPSENVSVAGSDLREIVQPTEPEQPGWNRWLLLIQTFTIPLFLRKCAYDGLVGGTDGWNSHLVSVAGSSVAAALILLTTRPGERPPGWYRLLSFVGFVVGIGWMSRLANEVVGALKAVGLILGWSDAILGLTVFAIGNSVGDLAANVTFCRLGFPMMALGACFGGPMLNILLGIGLAGLYVTVGASGAGRFEIEVPSTLWTSGLSLLVTLLGLLVVTPARGWKMDRKVGVGLMAVWLVTTGLNVMGEVYGLDQK